jgi:amino acid transporter
MSVTALFSTAGATNAGLYPVAGLCEQLASVGQFPPVLGRRLGGRAPAGLLITAAVAIVLATGLDLSSIASIGSAIALMVFALVTAAHFRVRAETGASALVLGAHHAGQRARDRGRAGGHRAAERRPRPRMETRPGRPRRLPVTRRCRT